MCIHLHSNMDRLKEFLSCNQFLFIIHLHSNMDRLKEKQLEKIYDAYENLHSNMDRLKADNRVTSGNYTNIYIPIWID